MTLSTYKWPLIGGGFLVGALLIAFLLGVLAPEPPKSEPPPQAPLVSTHPVEVRSGSLLVRGTGTVRPVREIQLTAQVGGRLVEVSDALVSGGRFEAGETLARIDPTDYRNAVRQAEARVTEAKVQLLQAREEAGAARRDYQRVRDRAGGAPPPDSSELGRLVFNEPQVEQAKSALESAKSVLDDARTNLTRTSLQVPFDGMVRTKQADLGGFVSPGTPVATVFGTESAEIVVSLPSRKAALIRSLWAPSDPSATSGVPAHVSRSYGGSDFTWDGYVHRVDGAIDERTRTVDVVVRVPSPYDGVVSVSSRRQEQPQRPERPPLAVGSYVTVDIEGRREGRYHVVPRRAVRTREPDQAPVVWTVAGDTMLVEREVDPIQTVETQTFLAPSLDPDVRVITTDLRTHSDSMNIRLAR